MSQRKRGPGRPPRTDSPERLTILIPCALKLRLRVAAALRGETIGALVVEALEQTLPPSSRLRIDR